MLFYTGNIILDLSGVLFTVNHLLLMVDLMASMNVSLMLHYQWSLILALYNVFLYSVSVWLKVLYGGIWI